MKLEIGSVVKSLKGRDKDSYFCVVELEGDYVYLCDGKIRKLENPKRKKIKHIKITDYNIHKEARKYNKHLKKAINSFIFLGGIHG